MPTDLRAGVARDHEPARPAGRAPRRGARHPRTPAAAVLAAARRGAAEQTAYRLTADNGWDTGVVAGDQSLLVPYAGPRAGLGAAGRPGGSRCGPTCGESDWSAPAWFETGPARRRRTGRPTGSSRPSAARRERPAPLLRPSSTSTAGRRRPPARHRPGHLRGVPQRRAGRRRRADPRVHPVRRRGCRCRPTTSPPRCGRAATRSASCWPTAGSAARSASPAPPTSGAPGWRCSPSCT